MCLGTLPTYARTAEVRCWCYSLILVHVRLPLSSLDFGLANSNFGPHSDTADSASLSVCSPSAVLAPFPVPCHPFFVQASACPLGLPVYVPASAASCFPRLWLSANDHHPLVADLIPASSVARALPPNLRSASASPRDLMSHALAAAQNKDFKDLSLTRSNSVQSVVCSVQPATPNAKTSCQCAQPMLVW
jgi:hypothetical protein